MSEFEMIENLALSVGIDRIVKLYKEIGRDLPSPEGYNSVSMCNTINIYCPWDKPHGYRTLLNNKKMYMIAQFADLAPNFTAVELGVYKGGVTRFLSDYGFEVTAFDTFEGIAGSGDNDLHQNGEFDSGDIEDYIPEATIVKGEIPGTLEYLPENIGFAHLDLDVYKPTKESLKIIWPLMSPGGVIILDDYGTWTTPGVRIAVDEFMKGRKIYLPTGQMVIIKG